MTTFQSTMVTPLRAIEAPTRTELAVTTGTARLAAPRTTLRTRVRKRPRRRSAGTASQVPSSDPTPMVAVRTPKPASDSPIGPGATANSTNTEKKAAKAMFWTPSMMASGRSTGWCQTNRAPSAMSSRSRVEPAGPAPTARKLPTNRTRQPAPTR